MATHSSIPTDFFPHKIYRFTPPRNVVLLWMPGQYLNLHGVLKGGPEPYLYLCLFDLLPLLLSFHKFLSI